MAKGKKFLQSLKITGWRKIYVFTFCTFKTSRNVFNVNRFQCKIFVQRRSSTFDRSSSATDHYWPAVTNLLCSCVLSNVWLDVPAGEPRGDMGLLYKVCSINISITVCYLTVCLHASIANIAKMQVVGFTSLMQVCHVSCK